MSTICPTIRPTIYPMICPTANLYDITCNLSYDLYYGLFYALSYDISYDLTRLGLQPLVCQISTIFYIFTAILLFYTIKSNSVIAFLAPENHKVDTDIVIVTHIAPKLVAFKCQLSAILIAIVIFFCDRPILKLMTSLNFVTSKTIK